MYLLDEIEISQNLLSLCEDVRLEIFKYLDKKDMESLSLTCKCGYDVTANYFERQTQLIISKPLNLKEFQAFSNSKRIYEDVLVILGKYSSDGVKAISIYSECDEIIFNQLDHLKMDVTSVRLVTEEVSNIQPQVLRLKTKYKTIKKVFVHLEDCVGSLDDIDQYKDEGICTSDITFLKVILDKDFYDCDREFIETFVKEFSGLKELLVKYENLGADYGWPGNEPDDFEQCFKVPKVTFYIEMSEKLSFLKLFQGITTLVIHNCTNTLFLETLLELNKTTLKTLEIEVYRPGVDKNLVIPCQLHALKIFTDFPYLEIEHLISNQNELQYLTLEVAFTAKLVRQLGDNCAPSLNIVECCYELCTASPSEVRPIPELPVVKHLEIHREDLPDFLPKTANLETLKIGNGNSNREFEFEGYRNLNGLELKYLKSIDMSNVSEHFLSEFCEIKLTLPSLENLICEFNLPLLKTYVNIKYLEVTGYCDFENILCTLEILLKLEELKVSLAFEDLLKTINHFESLDSDKYLKYVEITTSPRKKDIFKILEKLELIGEKLFCNYKGQQSFSATVGIDIKNKQYSCNFMEY